MKSKIFVIMALVLAVATAATAATALAEPKKKEPVISEHVADQVQATSQAILRLKVRAVPRGYQPPPVTFAAPPQ
ncbi:MAG: hypothetical protein H7X89_15405 [Rhizobiales bacterium]|nr:hypothetical protein [Hyphomicrobiales bacterium]